MFAVTLLLLFSKSTVSMQISIEQYRSRIAIHNRFVNAKDALSRFKDQFWNMMRVAPITDNGCLIVENSLQFSLTPKLKQFATQYKMWNEVMLWLTKMMHCNVIRQTNDVDDNLNPTIFDVTDPTVIFCKLEHA